MNTTKLSSKVSLKQSKQFFLLVNRKNICHVSRTFKAEIKKSVIQNLPEIIDNATSSLINNGANDEVK